jgi:putative glycosyltransferase (TIGR04348 family)
METSMKRKPLLCLVTPALAAANNGNWQTAARWARFLAADYRVRIAQAWDFEPADVMLALHARRSAPSIAAWAEKSPHKPLVLALTGTDLYRDILSDAAAQRSLQLASRLIVLQELAPLALPEAHRAKAVVVFQSCSSRRTLAKPTRQLRALMVGHLREEKWPETYFEAARLLAEQSGIHLDHIGAPLDPLLGAQAQALMAAQPRYRWLGAVPHASVRARIQRAHVLVHCSRMEGGAHVVMEAVRSGTPVLASRIDGNVGMLGRDYAGYFEPGDAQGLARLLTQANLDATMLPTLLAQCAARAPLFDAAHERATLRQLIASLLETTP